MGRGLRFWAFDHTDLVFGSGGRIREDRAIFTSSGSTVDRLQTASVNGATWVSNSLACLLATIEADLDPAYGRYFGDFETIIYGVRRYKRTIATSAGPVHLAYFNNLVWDGERLVEEEKVSP